MDAPVAIDGSDGPLTVRRVVVWRRLEPGDVRTPGTELAPESPHLEAKVVSVGIAESLREDLERLWKKKTEVTAIAHGWTTRYEPGGVLFALGGGIAVGAWLDFLPDVVLPFAGSLTALGGAIGFFTRTQKKKKEREAAERWEKMPEREELAEAEAKLKPRWEAFAKRLKEEQGFRTDVRVGDIHEADRLVSLDAGALVDPATWAPDEKENEVRYGWVYSDGRVVEQVAELEDSEREPEGDAEPIDTEARAVEEDEPAPEADADDADADEALASGEESAAAERAADDEEADEEQEDEVGEVREAKRAKAR